VKKILFLVLILSYSVCFASFKIEDANDFKMAYQNNYNSLWKQLHDIEKQVFECNLNGVKLFFLLYYYGKSITECSEFFQETLEKFIIKSPDCFFTAINAEKEEVQKFILFNIKFNAFGSPDEIEKINKILSGKNYRKKYSSVFKIFENLQKQ